MQTVYCHFCKKNNKLIYLPFCMQCGLFDRPKGIASGPNLQLLQMIKLTPNFEKKYKMARGSVNKFHEEIKIFSEKCQLTIEYEAVNLILQHPEFFYKYYDLLERMCLSIDLTVQADLWKS